MADYQVPIEHLNNPQAIGQCSHAEGINTTASGVISHAEGNGPTASGAYSHAEGYWTNANGLAAHAEGMFAIANGLASHAEGNDTIASGTAAHAEGEAVEIGGIVKKTQALGSASHAEGQATTASGAASHSEGRETKAEADYAHAEGFRTIASGAASHAEGINTDTAGRSASHVMGRNGAADESTSWFLVNSGIMAKISGNTGNAYFFGTLHAGAGRHGYAEMYETVCGEQIEAGYFVTLEGDKIRKANEMDDYILGITIANPAVLADSGELNWKEKYLQNEWGNVIYQAAVMPGVTDEEERVILPEQADILPVLNPEWDRSQEYLPRSTRPEWVPVGLLGKLLLRDDGTCQVNGYCKPDQNGIATSSCKGYRVMKRTGPNQVLIHFK